MVFRIPPAMGPEMYRSYTIRAPRSTHQRRATCEEVDCRYYQNGWQTQVDEATELGARQAAYIRAMSGRRFIERREGELTLFDFYAEQQCFGEHYMSLDREPQYLMTGGDWRGNPRGDAPMTFSSFDSWANHFGEHQDVLRRAQS